jgi:hypothetical protein
MSILASRHFHRVRRAMGRLYLGGNKEHPAVDPPSPDELRQILDSGKPHIITLIGIGGWAIILWDMIFKPV